MKNVDKILEELRKGTPTEKIHKQYPSWSQFYEALKKFMPEAVREIEAKRSQIQSLNNDINSLDSKKLDLDKIVNEHTLTLQNLENSEAQSKLSLETLEKKIESKQGELQEINVKLSEFEKKGVTLDFINRVYKMEFDAGDDLLKKVKTSQDYANLQKELSALDKKKADALMEIAKNDKTKSDLINDIKTQQSLLDEWKLETKTYKEAIDVTIQLFDSGYNNNDLKSLKNGLDHLGLKDNPDLSIQRLTSYLEKTKTLIELEVVIQRKEAELQTLTQNVAKAEGEYNTYKEILLKALEEAKKKATEAIEKSGKDFKENINDLNLSLNELRDTALETGKTIGKLEALAPILNLLEKNEGEPGQVLSSIYHIAGSFNLWLDKHQKLHQLEQPLKYLIKSLDIAMSGIL